MKLKRFLIPLVLSVFIISFSKAQTFSGSDILPKDPAVLTGTLKNGLSYYIRTNHKPEKRIEFRLVVNAGSILEDEDQQGLAHFLEHMAFNGSKHFSKNDLVSYLEESGVSFGADLNAYTSFDETVYMFQMPSDRPGLIDSAFLVLEDWAHNLLLQPEEIDKERGVIKEEWRLGLGATDRMQKKTFPIIFKDSRYAERLPIGKIDVIDTFPYEAIERFYGDWYRPDLMSVIIVGDIDPSLAEKKIRKHFNKLKNPKTSRTREVYDIPVNVDPLIAVASDIEATSNTVVVFYKQDKKPFKTYNDYRYQILLNLYSMMLNARLSELSEKPDAPFLFASGGYGEFIARTSDVWQTYAAAKENEAGTTLAAIILENKRVKKHGFTPAELERQKAEIQSFFESGLQEKDKTESSRYVREYISHFLSGEPFPGIENEYDYVESILPEITVDEVNALSEKLVTKENMVIMITGPDSEVNKIPDEKEVLQRIMLTKVAKLEPYEEKELGSSLIQGELPGGNIVSRTQSEGTDLTVLKLDNGITVVLKPTDFKNDEILMTAFNEGGTSVTPDSLYFSSSLASVIISQSGVGAFNTTDLTKFLSGKNVSVNPQIGDLTQSIAGSSTKKDFETMLQLAYLYFKEPRFDETAFETFKSRIENQVRFLRAEPQVALYDTMFKLATGNDPRTIMIPTEAQIAGLNLETAYEFYKDRFADAEGFHFFFVGSFSTDSIIPLIEKYLGSLPSTNRDDHWVDVSPEFPEGITEVVVHKGIEPKSTVFIITEGPFEWNRRNRLTAGMLMKILDIQLRENMREEQGGVYGVSARLEVSKYPKQQYSITINWGCAPENVDTLVATVFKEMKVLRTGGPSEENMLKAREIMIRDLETNATMNQYWLNVMRNSYYYDEKTYKPEELKELINSISGDEIRQVAIRFFKDDHYLKAILMPEEAKEE